MPITRDDVLAVLADPLLSRMNFSIGEIFVNAREYGKVAEYIRDGDIGVIPGKDPVAYYDGRLNTIETQQGNGPLGLADRAQILHECTHAIADINALAVPRLNDEVAGYLAQLTYMHLANPGPFPASAKGAGPLGRLVVAMGEVIQKYSLHQPTGLGVSISDLDIWKLATDVHRMPLYARIKPSDMGNPKSRGVPVKNNQMRALRAALTQGRRQTHTYTPSPRIAIF
ncbi:hypothetical protein FHP25_35170 [Vineibacter terrae]|uniref:Uncharacterized protein n=1 Tax=Vineibacter terrae TaxID=2586908 RepID=A0A5C8P930_9HYPH|nr:hypothetical protein [Vineibacter terrae]TXL70270.1 hypothetical protein FHP25_35170 [Vineibacter terrae]